MAAFVRPQSGAAGRCRPKAAGGDRQKSARSGRRCLQKPG